MKKENLIEGDWVDVAFRGRIADVIQSPRGVRYVIEVENIGLYVEPIPASLCKPVALGSCRNVPRRSL